MNLYDLPIFKLRELIQRKEISPMDILESVIKRIEERESEINGYISLYIEDAKREIEKITDPSEHPLTGIPIAVKDNIAVKGKRLTCGSKILEPFISPYDATAIERLKTHKTIILGKTNMDEFAMGSSNENSYFGPVHNPFDLERVSGGSSGGSAAVVAYGGAIAALGSDTGGSVRQPAAFCGVVGLKPTYGRVSRYGLVAFASSLDVIGPITKSVKDAGIILSVIAGLDPRDATSVDRPIDFLQDIEKPLEDLIIGVPKEYFQEGLDKEVKESVLKEIEGMECRDIIDISLPHTRYAVACYQILAMAEASSNLARYDGVRYGYRRVMESLMEMYGATREEGFGAEVKRRILLGGYGLSKGYYDEYYLTAQRTRSLIKRDFEDAFKRVDVIITPTTPTPAFRLGEKQDPLSMYLCDIFTAPASLAGLPAISIPAKERIDGLPVGVQIIGRPFDEKTVLRTAYGITKV